MKNPHLNPTEWIKDKSEMDRSGLKWRLTSHETLKITKELGLAMLKLSTQGEPESNCSSQKPSKHNLRETVTDPAANKPDAIFRISQIIQTVEPVC